MEPGDWIALAGVVGGLAVALVTLHFARESFHSALRNYEDNARGARLAHMHKLFGDYLGHELEYQFANAGGGPASAPAATGLGEAKRSLNAFKMYSLEEMWLWLENEQRQEPRTPLERSDRERLVTGWTNTIRYHLAKSTDEDLARFLVNRDCYSDGFVHLVLDQASTRKRLAGPLLMPLLGLAGDEGDGAATADYVRSFYASHPPPAVHAASQTAPAETP
jgi:hypothetical protein